MYQSDGVSAFFKAMKSYNETRQLLSWKFETPAFAALKRSPLGQYENSSAAYALGKMNRPMVVADVMRDLKSNFVKIEPSITAAMKLSGVTQLSNQLEGITSASKLLEQDREWHRKMDNIFSPMKHNSAALALLYGQSNQITKLFAPSVTTYLRERSPIDLENEDLSTFTKAIYQRALEEIESNENSAEAIQDITEQLEANPGWKMSVLRIAIAFRKELFENGITVAIRNEFIKKYGKEQSVSIVILSMIMFTCVKYGYPYYQEYLETQKEEVQDNRLTSLEHKDVSKQRRLNELVCENQEENKHNVSKETLHQFLNRSLVGYEAELIQKLKADTVKRYTRVASLFIDYLFEHTDHTSSKQVTKNDIDNFVADVKYDVLMNFEEVEIKNKLGHFLNYNKR